LPSCAPPWPPAPTRRGRPCLAVARGVDLAAVRWGLEIEYLRIVNDLGDGVRMRLVIGAALHGEVARLRALADLVHKVAEHVGNIQSVAY
jgi:hypothetical protein